MKIDVHAHTKKTKSGDAETRNVTVEAFADIIRDTDVKILAITNHNHFDIKQYTVFRDTVFDYCKVWPGIELDIVEDNRRGHLIVIVNPKEVIKFNIKIQELLNGFSADNFMINISDMVIGFKDFDAIFIPHYFVKKPALIDEDINKLCELVENPNRVIKEATNSISAGIYISHGHKSIYGTDIHDWSKYVNESKNLPEIRLPIETFEHFCLLLDKDEPTINTFLNNKKQEELELFPFEDCKPIKLNVYNDINILFGSKGTGKSEILKAIAKYYSDKGINVRVYQSSEENLEQHFDIKGNNITFNLDDYNIDNCEEEIQFIRFASEENVTSILNYYQYYNTQITNKKANAILLKDISLEDDGAINRIFLDITGTLNKIFDFYNFVTQSDILKSLLDDSLQNELIEVLNKVSNRVRIEKDSRYMEKSSIKLLNQIIEFFNHEISKKIGSPTKPTSTGFKEYARNRIKIETNVKKILENLSIVIPKKKDYVGDLGVKGKLDCITEFRFQDGFISDGALSSMSKINKTPQKEFVKGLKEVADNTYTDRLFSLIADMFEKNGVDTILQLNHLVLFKKYFAIEDNLYKPSNGEASMLLLHNELMEEKEIYLLDEPEKSLGNDYINDVIVPILKEHAKAGKRIIIATHDANIAVRTLPYNSIYRKHNIDNYLTYIGNPFSNNLVCTETGDTLDWKETSMKTLEGGKEAFGERGKIYGDFRG